MSRLRDLFARTGQTFSDPPFARALFSQPDWAWVWLVARFWLGAQWVQAAAEKISNPAWMSSGLALKGFWAGAILVPDKGRPPITYGWYRGFIEYMYNHGHYVWFAKLVVLGELAVGIALILGAFVGIAALMGALMNFNFMLAGSASTNPVLFGVAVLLIMGWKTAGWFGLDRWLLPAVGTPWQAGKLGKLVHRHAQPGQNATQQSP